MAGLSLSSSLSVRLSPPRASVTPEPAPVMLPYTLIFNFENLGSATAFASTLTLTTGPRKVLGNAAFQVDGNGSAGGNSVTTNASISFNFAGRDRIAFCLDIGGDLGCDVGTMRPQLDAGANSYRYFPPATTGLSDPVGQTSISTKGKIWVSYALKHFRLTNSSGAQIIAAGTVNVNPQITATLQNGGYASNYVVDALICPDNSHKPTLIIGFDDYASDPDVIQPILDARGLKSTWYIPTGRMNATRTLAKLQTLAAAGHGISLDGTSSDDPITNFATRAAWIADLNAMRDWLLANVGSSIADDVKQICYPNGRQGYQPDFVRTITCNGTNTLTLPGIDATACTVGQPILGTNVPAGTVVASIVSQTDLTTNNIIPAGSQTLTFAGWKNGMAVTANGTDTVTVANIDGLFVGETIYSAWPRSVEGAKIIALPSSTSVQFDRVIPASCVRMALGYVDGEWWQSKVRADLIANGYQSARTVGGSATGGYFTGYGIGAEALMSWPGYAPSATASEVLARLDRAIEDGYDSEWYMHLVSDMTWFTTVMDGVKARVDAGLLQVKTKGSHIRSVLAKVPIS